MWREQAIIEWSWYVNSIVACCHSAKLCAHDARDFRSQQYQWRTQKIFMGDWFRVIWWSFGVRCLWRHNLTSFPCFQTNVLAKVVDVICMFFYIHSPYFMCHCTKYKLSALQVRLSEKNRLDATTQQFITAKISGCVLKQGSETHSSLRQSNLQLQNQAAMRSRQLRAVEHWRCAQNRRQKVCNRGFAVLRGGFSFVRGDWHHEINQNSTYLSVSRFNLGVLGALFTGAKPTEAPRGDGTGCAAGLAGAHPGLQDRILLNYTRIENAHKVHMKTFVFCDV